MTLIDGEVIDAAGLKITVMATPGHTADSLSFVLEDAVLTADTVLGRGTTVIDKEDGSLTDYLESLQRLRGLGRRTVLPGHGPDLADLEAVASGYLVHRHERLEQVRAALRDLGEDARRAQIVEHVYIDVDEKLWDAAEWSVQAQLDYLLPAPSSASSSTRARRASRSESEISTLLPSSRIQPRWAKSASALFTVSREAPTSWAISSCVRSWVTRIAPPSWVPNRWASCSSCLATRPGTSVKIRSARLLLVRRSRRANTRSSCSAISGRSAIHARSASRSIDTARTSVIVVALDVRGPGSKIDNSPNMSDGPMIVSRFSRPSGDRRPILTLPRDDDVQPIARLPFSENGVSAGEVDGL